jgi:hypothetical protein
MSALARQLVDGRPLRSVPQLVLTIALEQPGRLQIDATTFEDERRLVTWLRRSRLWAELAERLEQALDQLEERAA